MKRFFAPTIFFAATVTSLIAAPSHGAPKSLALAPSAVSASRGAASGDQGMVIKGDQEAPLVLYIVPWQEPKVQVLPEAPLQALLPVVLDSDRSLVDDPINRSLGVRDGAKGK